MPEQSSLHILINGLSMGSGGGYTVGCQLLRYLAPARPRWKFTLAAIEGKPLHEQLRTESFPANCMILWAPAFANQRVRRSIWERTTFVKEAARLGVHAVIQLNGLIIPGMKAPTLSHNQDPWPYRREAWVNGRERAMAFLKRRAHGKALRRAACVGWTSKYLESLVCEHHGFRPACSEVFYNGLPAEFLERSNRMTEWAPRPMQIVTVSNVEPYKRHDLVIRAVGELVKESEFRELRYCIAGFCSEPHRRELQALISSLGLDDRVMLEGRVSNARVSDLMASSRCFALMSVCESFGIPAIEAMSFGTPVVTADCCAMPEVCGNAADLCPPNELPPLVNSLRIALTDASHADRMRSLGVERIRQFDWRQTAEQMAQRLEKMTGG